MRYPCPNEQVCGHEPLELEGLMSGVHGMGIGGGKGGNIEKRGQRKKMEEDSG